MAITSTLVQFFKWFSHFILQNAYFSFFSFSFFLSFHSLPFALCFRNLFSISDRLSTCTYTPPFNSCSICSPPFFALYIICSIAVQDLTIRKELAFFTCSLCNPVSHVYNVQWCACDRMGYARKNPYQNKEQ